MATYKQGVLGPFSGKVGTVVGSSWRGIAYIRSLATKVGNPRTAGQVAARSKLALVARTLKNFASVIKAGFVNTGSVSPWSAAIKANLLHVKDSDSGLALDMRSLVLSDGSDEFSLTPVKTAASVDFSWKAPRVADLFYGGKLYAAAFNAANAKAMVFVADLSASSASMSLSSILSGEDDDVNVYYFVAAPTASTPTTCVGD